MDTTVYRCARSRLRSPSRGRTLRLQCEQLEPRLVMYALSGYSWSNPTSLSYSYVPDGTSTEGYTSTLFSELNAIAPTDAWQREFARALQTWSDVSNVNFHLVPDSGVASGSTGPQGDVRLAAHPLSSGYLAYTYYPSSGIGGDMMLATAYTFQVGADYDLYSVTLHELGHSLGLAHSSVAGAVMWPSYQGILSGLTADDIAGIQALYGARHEDSFDAVARNDSLSTASPISMDASGSWSYAGDLTSLADVDYFRVTAPLGSDGTLQATVNASGVSLLQPRVMVYDGSGNLIASADGTIYGDKAAVNLSGLTPGQTYYVVADGATADVFGMGQYNVSVGFGGLIAPPPPPPPPPPPSAILPDRFEVNDTLATATSLGKFNSHTETSLTLHTSTDHDDFKLMPKSNGVFHVTTQYASTTGQHEIKVFNSQKVLIASVSGTSLDVSLASNKQYYVVVDSPSGTLDTYNLSIQNLAGGGLQTISQGTGALRTSRGDGEAVDAAIAEQEDAGEPRAIGAAAVDHLLASWQPEFSPRDVAPPARSGSASAGGILALLTRGASVDESANSADSLLVTAKQKTAHSLDFEPLDRKAAETRSADPTDWLWTDERPA